MRLTTESSINLSSGALVALGASVILGWHLGILRIVQIDPAFPPMQYSTALGFLLAGLAARFARSRPRVSTGLAIALIAIGLVSLLQYALQRNFEIDQLLTRTFIAVETSGAARMAPQTAIAFVLGGVALVVSSVFDPRPLLRLATDVAGSVLGGLGLAALVGYAIGVEPVYGWGDFKRIALHTAAGLVLLGFAILQNSWRATADRQSKSPLLAIPVAAASLAVVLSLFQGLSQWQRERIDERTVGDVERAATALEERLLGYVQSFAALTAPWMRAGGEPQRSWENDVARFLRDQKVFLAVSHGRSDGRLDWIFPLEPFPEHLGFDYSTNATRSTWLAVARERSSPVLSPPLQLKSGRPGMLIIAPLSPANDGTFAVAATLLDELLREATLAAPAYQLAVFDGERRVYGTEAPNTAQRIRSREIRVGGAALQLEATPLPETMAALRSPLPAFLLISGIVASLLLALTAHVAQVSSRRARDLAATNQALAAKKRQLERLALFDELTGLGNRNLLLAELEKALESARRSSVQLPLLLLDLNGFKTVNDTFGHDAGDRVLSELAARLTETLPLSAEAFRTGGDEFAVITRPGTSLDEALEIARAIERSSETPVAFGNEQLVVRAAIGIALYPDHGKACDRLLRAADVAMYQAKRGATGIQVASDESPTAVLRALPPRR